MALLLTAPLVAARANQTREPDFTLVVLAHFDAETLAEFRRRATGYTELRRRAEAGLKPLAVTEDADEIEEFERSLASRLRRLRSSARGQVFTREMARQVRRMLRAQADPGILAVVQDEDDPVNFDIDINDTYSKKRALATMPVKILLLLPDLPPEMEYRFVGRHMILRDVRANTIIDEIPDALPRMKP